MTTPVVETINLRKRYMLGKVILSPSKKEGNSFCMEKHEEKKFQA